MTEAYLTYALLATGTPAGELATELDRLVARAAQTLDPYEMAVAAGALHHGGYVANLVLENVTFADNRAAYDGGAVCGENMRAAATLDVHWVVGASALRRVGARAR